MPYNLVLSFDDQSACLDVQKDIAMPTWAARVIGRSCGCIVEWSADRVSVSMAYMTCCW